LHTTNYAVILHLYTKPMKRMFKTLTHILASICLVWSLGSCNQTSTNKDVKNEGKKDTSEKGTGTIPTTLDNFDLTYYGRLKGTPTLLNLRRYGSSLSGDWWISETEQVQITGSLQNDTDQFQMEVANLTGDKIGMLHGKLTEDKTLKCTWKSNKDDSVAIDFLPMARNVKVFRLKLEELKVSKLSQNGKRAVTIAYPQVLGIEDASIAKHVNSMIEKYFNANTLMDSLDKAPKDFKEEVRYEITQLNNELISVCKHHHLDKADGNTMFDDSHGITVNFKRGKIYELRDLFKANSIEALNAMLLARINKSCGNALASDILEKCKMKGAETTSFSLGKGKVTFHLTERLPENIRGCGYVRIDCKDLRDFINPSGPLAEYLYDKPTKK